MKFPDAEIKLGKDTDASAIIQFWKENNISLSGTDNAIEVAEAAKVFPELFLVAFHEGKIAGTVWGNFDGRRGFVVHFAVRKDLRKLGLGKMLMDKLEDAFRALGCKKIHLFIEKTNLVVESYYDRRGFKRRDDLIIMSKDL